MTKHFTLSNGLCRFSGGAALIVIALIASGCGKTEKPETKATGAAAFTTPEQKVSYGIGLQFGAKLGSQPGLTVDQEALRAGLEDGISGAKPRLDDRELQAAFTVMQQKAEAVVAEQAKANLVKANDYLAQNAKKFGVKTTASGLQYEIIKSGKGPKPKVTDRVEVNYHGTLPDGTIFDSSVQRGAPVQFACNEVIRGWTEALQLMSVGDKWRLVIPPGLGYGPRPNGKIPPNSTLIFEVELLGIK